MSPLLLIDLPSEILDRICDFLEPKDGLTICLLHSKLHDRYKPQLMDIDLSPIRDFSFFVRNEKILASAIRRQSWYFSWRIPSKPFVVSDHFDNLQTIIAVIDSLFEKITVSRKPQFRIRVKLKNSDSAQSDMERILPVLNLLSEPRLCIWQAELQLVKMDRNNTHELLKSIGTSMNPQLDAQLKPQKTSRLRYLNLSECNINDDGAILCAQILRTGVLEKLSLDYNSIGDSGLSELCQAFRQSRSLKYLSLYNNLVGEKGIEELAKCLMDCATLQYLNLGRNFVGDKGMKIIAEALKVNTSLRELHVEIHITDDWKIDEMIHDLYYHYHVTDVGVEYLAEALINHPSITTINLSRNIIGDKGSVALAKLVRSKTRLSSLLLQRNQIGDHGARELASALRFNCQVSSDLRGNPFGYEGTQALREARSFRRNIPGSGVIEFHERRYAVLSSST